MSEKWHRVAQVFEGALDLPAENRQAWVEQTCRSEPEVAEEVRELLAAHGREDGILDVSLGEVISSLGIRDSEVPRKEFGPYELLRELGRGGMGVVYEARDRRLDRRVALKVLPPHLWNSDEANQRLLGEARAASALDHPNICAIYDIGHTPEGGLFIAMSLCEGETLRELLLRRGALPESEALDIVSQVATALQAAHEAGIVHRDIKPSNIIVGPKRRVRLLDFGVAKLEGNPARTGPGIRVGTVAYMSPEQAMGEEVDHRTDLWSLGAVLYETLSGEQAFRGANAASALRAIVQTGFTPSEEARRRISPPLLRLISACLASDRTDRPAGAMEFLSLLKSSTPPAGAEFAMTLPGPRDTSVPPTPLTTFIGREEELQRLSAMLETSRLVTLTGPAGTGKTRLALELARMYGGVPRQGISFIDLSATDDTELLFAVLVRDLGFRPEPGESSKETLLRSLQGGGRFLILDNFEQLVAAAPDLVDLLESCAHLRLLVTSRISLQIPGERELPLTPLPLPQLQGEVDDPGEIDRIAGVQAVALFLDRARAVDPSFLLTRENADTVVEICRRLDGLPLALEIAAGWLRILTPQALLRQLGDRLDLVQSAARNIPGRRQTLRQAVGWSYERLSPLEQTLFRRLAAFSGSFPWETAHRVCLPDLVSSDFLNLMVRLVDHHLVSRDSTGGQALFSMLTTIRAFAREKLEEAGENEAVESEHSRFHLTLAERAAPHLVGAGQVAWLERLEADHDGLRLALTRFIEQGLEEEALRMGGALWRFWLSRGHLPEGLRRLRDLLDRFPAGGSRRTPVLLGLAALSNVSGDNTSAADLLEECLALHRQTGDERGLAAALNQLAWVDAEICRFNTSRRRSKEAFRLNRSLGEKRGMALALNNLGWVANYLGHCRIAAAYHEGSLALRREIGDERGIAFALSNLSWAETDRGRYERAREQLDEAQAILKRVDDKVLTSWALVMRGSLEIARGDFEDAERSLTKSLTLWSEVGNNSGKAWAISCLAYARHRQGHNLEARRLVAETTNDWRELKSHWGAAMTLCVQGRIALADNRPDEAAPLLRASLRSRRELRDRRGVAECLDLIAFMLESHGDHSVLGILDAARRQRNRLGLAVPRERQPELDLLRERALRIGGPPQPLSLKQAVELCLKPESPRGLESSDL